MVAAKPGVDLAPLYYRRIEQDKIKYLKRSAGDYDAIMSVTDIIRQDLSWWIDNAHLAVRHIIRKPPSVKIFSDSSNAAWGGTYLESVRGGPLAGEERDWHINAKELKAAFLTLKAFCSEMSQIHVELNIDNTTSVTYINKQGGKKPLLNDITREM